MFGAKQSRQNLSFAKTLESSQLSPSFIPTHSRLRSMAAVLFAKLGGALAVCANGPCSRLFIKRKRQVYCTTRCLDTVNKRAYWKRSQNSPPPSI